MVDSWSVTWDQYYNSSPTMHANFNLSPSFIPSLCPIFSPFLMLNFHSCIVPHLKEKKRECVWHNHYKFVIKMNGIYA